MNVGATGMDPASQFGIAAFQGATKTQASAAMKLLESAAPQGSSSEMSSAAMSEQGKGLNVNTTC